MYVKIENGAVSQFPYSVPRLRRDNPETSFPANPSEELLNSHGVYQVFHGDMPSVDVRTQKVNRSDEPSLINGQWTLTYTAADRTAEEIQAYDDQRANDNRNARNVLLAQSDWTQMNDSPLTNEEKTAWATYRQELRDISDLDAWPNLADEDWPVAP